MARPKGEAKAQIRFRLPLELVARVQEMGAEWLEGVLIEALEPRAERPVSVNTTAGPALKVMVDRLSAAKPRLSVFVPLAGTFERRPLQKRGKG